MGDISAAAFLVMNDEKPARFKPKTIALNLRARFSQHLRHYSAKPPSPETTLTLTSPLTLDEIAVAQLHADAKALKRLIQLIPNLFIKLNCPGGFGVDGSSATEPCDNPTP